MMDEEMEWHGNVSSVFLFFCPLCDPCLFVLYVSAYICTCKNESCVDVLLT